MSGNFNPLGLAHDKQLHRLTMKLKQWNLVILLIFLLLATLIITLSPAGRLLGQSLGILKMSEKMTATARYDTTQKTVRSNKSCTTHATKLSTAIPKATVQQLPQQPSNGYWHRVDRGTVSLECFSGFVPTTGSVSRLAGKEDSWLPPLSDLTCSEAVVILIGGNGKDGRSLLKMELIGPGLHQQYEDVPVGLEWPLVSYANSRLVMCGGSLHGGSKQYSNCHTFSLLGDKDYQCSTILYA